MTQGYQLDHSLSQRLSKHYFDNVVFEHVGLIRVLPLAVHMDFVHLSDTQGYLGLLSELCRVIIYLKAAEI